MQSTENKTESRPPADVLRLMRDYRQMLLDDSDASWPAGVVAADIGWLLKDTESALAAERDRADRAEARIAGAPHAGACRRKQSEVWPCTCFKSEATA